MNKPIINYKGFMQEDPSDRTKRICVPQIVDRNQTKSLADIVYGAIDRGLIAGLKPEAAQSIADGIMTQLGETLNDGTGVLFGDYFSVRPYLSGTMPNVLSQLGPDNKLRARFIAGSAYRLDEKKFSFHNVTQSEELPGIDAVQPNRDDGEDGTWDSDGENAVIGKNIKLGDGDELQLFNCDGEDPVSLGAVDADDITTNSDKLLVFAFGETPVPACSRLGFKVVKTIEADGVSVTVESQLYTAVKTIPPTPVPGEPTITGAKTQGDEDDHVNVSGGTLDVTGENLETATAIELLNASGELWQTVEATYADGKLTAELEFEDRPSATGAVRVTTAGGSATHNVSYSSH